MGCVGAWSLHPVQIDIAKKVFSPPPDEVKFAKKVLEAIPDGRGVHMIDGKMQDDATWKQCKVMVELAEMLADKDPELAEAYELGAGARLIQCVRGVRASAGGDNAESRPCRGRERGNHVVGANRRRFGGARTLRASPTANPVGS